MKYAFTQKYYLSQYLIQIITRIKDTGIISNKPIPAAISTEL